MRRRWHILPLALSAASFAGCYLDHGLDREDPARSCAVAVPVSGACGCAADQLCVRSCSGERSCVPTPTGTRTGGCPPSVSCCYETDPCEAISGSWAGRYDRDGALECACFAPPPPPAPPSDTPCGSAICASDEICVETCSGVAPACVPVGDPPCRDACECFEDDPCRIDGPSAACVDVVARSVVCACAGPPPSCEDYLAGAPITTCDESFGECARPIDGVPCCSRVAFCADGVVQEEIACDDSCAQGCRLIGDERDCAAYGCEWVPPTTACVGEPIEWGDDWVVGPACIGSRGATCETDEDCAPATRCLGFPYDPCAGSACDACFALERFCVADG